MKSFTFFVNDDLRYDCALLLNVLGPVCSLISLYNGPSLNDVELKTEESNSITARGLKNEYTFTFHFDVITKTSVFNYFFKGESQLKLTLHRTGETLVHLPERTSLTIELELRKALLKYSLSESEIKESLKNNSPKTSIIKETFEFKIPLSKSPDIESKFITRLNDMCTLLTQNRSPKFGPEDLKVEERSTIREVFSSIDKSNDLFTIAYENSEFETGHWSGSKGGHTQFLLTQKNQILMRASISGRIAHFEVSAELKDLIAEIINDSDSII